MPERPKVQEEIDVAVIGGGPGGSTVACLLATYRPDLNVAVFERETFPREHVGESLLPTVGRILNEMGAWDAVETANFPIKIGATYKWGTTDDLWDFNFIDTREIDLETARPAQFAGWRSRAAFQVDRSKFDKVLLDRARDLGVCVYEGRPATQVIVDGDVVMGLELTNGDHVSARTYVDASGNAGILRRALGVETEEPAALRNIAFWDYWTDASWAVTIGTSATRVQVSSLGYGWLWVIPIAADRTSIGLVCPAEYYKKLGKKPEDLYYEAVLSDPRVASLILGAKPDGRVKATRDWSFVAKRMFGENWYLVGESAGFADPILAAGITMTMVGARECAYTILERDKGNLDQKWLKESFESRQKERISQHIKFANYWYTANSHFSELVEFTSDIAKEAGYDMDPKTAWQWLGAGGFISLETAGAGLAGHSMGQIKNIQKMMLNEETPWLITQHNSFDLDLQGSEEASCPIYQDGAIQVGKLYARDGRKLPVTGGIRVAIAILQKERELPGIVRELRLWSAKMGPVVALSAMEAIETMLKEGWVRGSTIAGKPLLRLEDIPRTSNVDWNHDAEDPKVRRATGDG